eukprot:669330-Hanusia_phi.AAC.1
MAAAPGTLLKCWQVSDSELPVSSSDRVWPAAAARRCPMMIMDSLTVLYARCRRPNHPVCRAGPGA